MATSTSETRSVDAERIDGGRRMWRPVLAVVVAGLVVGGAIGAAVGSSTAATYTASTSTTDNTLNQDATAFIQGELVVLNGRQLAEQVQRTLGLASTPSPVATEIGQTYAVRIDVDASSGPLAERVATGVASAYIQLRRSTLSTRIRSQLAATSTQLATVRASLATAQGQAGSTGASLTPSEAALQTEYQRLLQQGNVLNSELTQVSSVVSVLTPADSSSSAGSTL